MAKINVERGKANSGWWVLAALVVLGLLAALLFTDWSRWDDARPEAALYGQNEQPALRYQGEAWRPEGAAVAYRNDQMVQVGESREGFDLYVPRVQEMAGGGGGAAPRARGRVERIYVRTTEGLYQPFVRRQ